MRHRFRGTLMAILGSSVIAGCVNDDDLTGVIVVPPPRGEVNSVTLSPSTLTLVVDDSLPISAVARDRNGVALVRTPVWASTDSAVAVVRSNGTVVAVASGTAVITATVEGEIGQTQLTVMRGTQSDIPPAAAARAWIR